MFLKEICMTVKGFRNIKILSLSYISLLRTLWRQKTIRRQDKIFILINHNRTMVQRKTSFKYISHKLYRVYLAISRIRTYNVSNQLYLQLLHHQHLFLSNKSTFYHRNYNKPESAEIHSYIIGIHFLQNVFVLKHWRTKFQQQTI
jgi:hypothetical protein